MDERARRVGQNEALFRTVNEQIESLGRELADMTRGPMRVVCECGSLACTEHLMVVVEDYERIRDDPTLFIVKHGHESPDVETPVEENDEYVVVRMDESEPAELARATDPRS